MKPLSRPIPVFEKAPLFVGGARNVHGTRISKRVNCHKCGAVDYITARPRGQKPCCKSCAKEAMHAFEVGERVPKAVLKKQCYNCKADFDLPAAAKLKEDKALCSNCLNGFEIWRGSLAMCPESRKDMQFEKRRSGTLLRKKIAEKN